MSDAEVFDSQRMITLVREYLKERVAEGNCVVLGRGAASTLVNVPGTFHIFVYASTARKMAWFREKYPDRAEHAQQEIEATDRRRANYIRRFYNQQWDDHRLYQLMLNSCMGFPAMVGATLEAAGLAHSVPELPVAR